MSNSASKHAEFATLFAMFESMKTRSPSSPDPLDALPKDLEPVIRNLYSLMPPPATKRTRRATVSTPDVFPLSATLEGGNFPFTFKKMLHALYEIDDWKQKVDDVLLESQNQFKPLAEVQSPIREKHDIGRREKGESVSRVRFDAPPTGRTRRTSMRTRSHTVSGTAMPVSPTRPSARHAATTASPTEDIRVVKKRCVGRRPSAGGDAKHWIYTTAVSSVELNEARHSSVESLSQPQEIQAKKPKYVGLQEGGEPRTASVRRRALSVGGEAIALSLPGGKKRRSVSTVKVSDMGDVYASGSSEDKKMKAL